MSKPVSMIGVMVVLALLLLPGAAWSDLTTFDGFAEYDAALSGNHSSFVDFETDKYGNTLVYGNYTSYIQGDVFSDDVAYSSPDWPTTLVSIGNPGAPIYNEIGPYDAWSGTLRAAYSGEYFATGFTVIQGETTTTVSLYDGDSLVGSANLFYTQGLQFFGVISAVPFDRMEISGDFYAIDAHYSTVIPAPGAALLGLIGLGAIGWIRRRIL